jgi:anti-anti-sigma factor
MGQLIETKTVEGAKGSVGLATILAPQIVTTADVSTFADGVIAFADNSGFMVMVLNLSKVESVSSPFFGTLIRLSKHLAERGANLRLCCLRKAVALALQACMMDKLLDIYPDQESAINP